MFAFSSREVIFRASFVACLVFCPGSAPAAEGSDFLAVERAQLDQRFNSAVTRLLADQEITEQERQARKQALIVRDPSRQYFYVPPELLPRQGEEPPVASTRDEPLDRLKRIYAQQLFDLARRAANSGDGATAFRWIHEVLFFDIDHLEARRVIGLPKNRVANRSPLVTIRRARHAHPRLRWPAGQYLQADTQHFRITTNHHEQATRKLAFTLEQLHAVWQQVFFDFWSHPKSLQAALAGRPVAPRRRAKHQVYLFRDRSQYVNFLRQTEPRAQMTLGYYHAPSRLAVFYGDENASNLATWRHEATHQLFHEKYSSHSDVGESNNFWIVEGVALYMESIQACRGFLTLGGLESDRLQFARYRALREGFYEPLARFGELGRVELQQDPRIRQLYSQAAGLTHFLMDDQHGRYRHALLQYIRAVYDGKADPNILIRLAKSENLDQQYRGFLQVDDQDLKQLEPAVTIRNLSLGETDISDEGLLALPRLDDLTWLDLTGTRISDAGTEHFDTAQNLRQLSLERTSIGDGTLRRLAKATQLQELDLSHTKITDESLIVVGGFKQLSSLWLTGTRVSDVGVTHLSDLSQLKTLDVTQTDVTSDGWLRLRNALPNLQAR